MRKSLVTKDGVNLVYIYNKIKSDKPTLIFLHGLGANWSQWKYSIIQAKKEGYSALAVDLRGHGLSEFPKDDKSYSLDKYVKDLKEILEHENIKNYIFIGHSFGGSVAITYCTEIKNSSPKAIVFVESTHKYPFKKYHELNQNSWLCFLLRKLVELKLIPYQHSPRKHELDIQQIFEENWLFRLFDEIYYTSFSTIFKALDGAKDYSMKKGKEVLSTLRNLKIPTFIMAGKDDHIINPNFSVEMHKIIPNSKLKMYDKAGHFFPLTNPKLFNTELFTFLSAI